MDYSLRSGKYSGVTANISSGGIFIATSEALPVNTLVKLSIDWPAVLDGHRLRLMVQGRVLRADYRGMALKIERHEFRVRAGAKPGTGAR